MDQHYISVLCVVRVGRLDQLRDCAHPEEPPLWGWLHSRKKSESLNCKESTTQLPHTRTNRCPEYLYRSRGNAEGYSGRYLFMFSLARILIAVRQRGQTEQEEWVKGMQG